MTRVAVLADIHGNLAALDAVIEDLRGFSPHAIVVAGDAICWGPESRAVLERLRELDAVCLRGNNEYYLLDGQTSRMPETWRNYSLIPPLIEEVGERWRSRIAAWPDSLSLRFPDAPPIFVCHGVPGDPWRGVVPGEEPRTFDPVVESILIGAHTHLPMDEVRSGHRHLNPGSAGVPLNGRFEAQYLRLRAEDAEWATEFRRVPYDVERLRSAFEESRFEARNGPIAKLVRREFETARIQVVPFLTFWRTEHPSCRIEEAIERFEEADRQRYLPLPYRRAEEGSTP